jgi:hypothetical protein
VTPEVRTLLSNAGFKADERFPGWLDWGKGDVLILDRE